VEPIDDYDHLYMYLYIVVFRYWWCLWIYMFFLVVGGVFMCEFIVDWVRLCFGFVC